jgi:hypothetical protein
VVRLSPHETFHIRSLCESTGGIDLRQSIFANRDRLYHRPQTPVSWSMA